MDHRRPTWPVAPLLASALLVVMGWWYLSSPAGSLNKADGVLRVVTWDVGARDGTAVDTRAIASALASLDADAIALQGLADAGQAGQLASLLGPGWRGETLTGPSGPYLALLAGPQLEIAAYHLIPTSTGDALALTLRHPTGRVFRLVSLEAAAGLGDERSRARYVNGILTWCSTRPAGLTVLAGPMEVDAETDSRLDQRFISVGAMGDGPKELRIEPKSTPVVRAARVGQASVAGVDSTPLLVDVPSP